ncbi:MAG: FAD-dependent oxidoreductase, partial [Rhodoferax sp.]
LTAQGFETVLIAIGAQAGEKLGIPGDDLPHVVDSPSFLRAATQGKIGAADCAISMGPRVAVIGGGNVATDNCRSSWRLGGQQVDMVYRRTREEMPAREDEVQGCIEAGVGMRFLTAPKKIALNPDGTSRLKITYAKMELGASDASGRRRPIEVAGSEFSEDVDLVIAAIGQHSQAFEGFGVQTGKGGRITVREDSMLTSRAGVFAGGDVVLGPASLIEAVAQGRKAAAAMDAFLGGDGNIEEKLLADNWTTSGYLGREDGFNQKARAHPHFVPKDQRNNWQEVELGFDTTTAQSEGQRCLKCNLAANLDAMALPPEAWLEFSAAVVAAMTEEAGVFQLLDGEKNVLMIKGVENLRQGLTEQLTKSQSA